MSQLNLSGINKGTLVRSILTIVFAINILAGYWGYELPIADADVAAMVDAGIIILTVVIWGWGWWKNNSLTLDAQKADAYLAKNRR